MALTPPPPTNPPLGSAGAAHSRNGDGEHLKQNRLRKGFYGHLLAFGLVLLVSLPGLIVGVVTPRESTHHMERRVLVSADETWRRAIGDADFEAMGLESYLIPTLNDADRIIKPPLAVWLTRLGWVGVDGHQAGWFELMSRARWVAIGMTCVLLLGTYLLGVSLCGGRGTRGAIGMAVGMLAGIGVGTSLIVQRWGRIAAYDIHLAGWIALGLGLAFLATRPGRATAHRHWLLLSIFGGGGLGFAWLSKGPIALLMMLVPLVVVAVVDRVRWSRHLGTLVVVLITGAFVALPWYGYVFWRVDDVGGEGGVRGVGGALLREYGADRNEASPVWTYLSLMALMLPWSVWFIGGLLLPWLGVSRKQLSHAGRTALLIAGGWLVVIVVVMSLPEAKQQRYILPVLPAAGLLVGLTAVHARRAMTGWASWLAPAHGVIVLGMSLAVYGFVILSAGDEALGLSDALKATVWVYGLGLVVVAGWVAASCWRHDSVMMLRRTACWVGLMLPLYWAVYLPVDDRAEPTIASGVLVREMAGDQPIAWLKLDETSGDPDEKMMVSLRRLIPKVGQAALGERSGLVVAKDDDRHAELLESVGFIAVSEPIADRGKPIRVWSRKALD
ncbi:MAG: hypothetical protein RLN76_12040 [Phycisphaeraceae bacterium]